MTAIRSVSKLENKVGKVLWKHGIRYRKNSGTLYGKPDFSLKKYKIVVFIDSCFWHQCPLHGNMPKSNIDYWQKKLNRNKRRDQEVTNYYTNKGWHILRIWEHDLKKNFDETTMQIVHFIKSIKASYH